MKYSVGRECMKRGVIGFERFPSLRQKTETYEVSRIVLRTVCQF